MTFIVQVKQQVIYWPELCKIFYKERSAMLELQDQEIVLVEIGQKIEL